MDRLRAEGDSDRRHDAQLRRARSKRHRQRHGRSAGCNLRRSGCRTPRSGLGNVGNEPSSACTIVRFYQRRLSRMAVASIVLVSSEQSSACSSDVLSLDCAAGAKLCTPPASFRAWPSFRPRSLTSWHSILAAQSAVETRHYRILRRAGSICNSRKSRSSPRKSRLANSDPYGRIWHGDPLEVWRISDAR